MGDDSSSSYYTSGLGSTMGSGGFSDKDEGSYYSDPAPSFDSKMGYDDPSASNGNYGNYNPSMLQQAEDMLGPGGIFGDSALESNPWTTDQKPYTSADVNYDAMDWLAANWKKYGSRLGQFGLGVLSRTNPAAATAYSLYKLFDNPRGKVAGQVGGTFGSALGGAINPALAGVGGMIGGEIAGNAAASAERQYGVSAGPTTGTTGASSNPDFGAVGAGLGQIWNRYGAAKEYKNQGQQLQDLYGQNSAYSQQLQQSLLRQDAQRGRRSQFGTRNVELQARLADLASRNAPQLQNLTKARTDERNRMYTDLYSLGRMLYD